MTVSVLVELILIALFALTVWCSYRRGFIKTVAGLLSVIGAAVCALFGMPAFSGYLEQRYIAPFVQSAVTEAAAETMAKVLAELQKNAQDKFDALIEGAKEYGLDIGSILNGSEDGAALEISEDVINQYTQGIVDQFAAPISLRLSEIAAFVIIFVLAWIVLRIAFAVLSAIVHLPILHGFDRLLGLCIGILLGALYAWIAANGVHLALTVIDYASLLPPEKIPVVDGTIYGCLTEKTDWQLPDIASFDLSDIDFSDIALPEFVIPSADTTTDNPF